MGGDKEFIRGDEAPTVVNFTAVIEEGLKITLSKKELEKIDAETGDMVNVSLRKAEEEGSEITDDSSVKNKE